MFVAAADVEPVRERVHAGLPATFRGWPTHYGWDEIPQQPWVEVTTLDAFLVGHLGFDPRPRLTAVDWLVMPQQLLLGVTAGAVFHDPDGELAALRDQLAWYPRDVWCWLLASQWRRIAEEEPFVGRTAEVGDDLGSRLLAARLAHDVMRLCFLFERRYAPYSKWFGTAFAQLDAAREIGPLLAARWQPGRVAEREGALVAAFEGAARRHNALGLTDPVDPTAHTFYQRPFRVLGADRFVVASRRADR